MYIEVQKYDPRKTAKDDHKVVVLGISNSALGLVSFRRQKHFALNKPISHELTLIFRSPDNILFDTYSFLQDGRWVTINPNPEELHELNTIASRIDNFMHEDKGKIYTHTLTYLMLKIKWIHTLSNLRIKPNGLKSKKVLELIKLMKQKHSMQNGLLYYANAINLSQTYINELCKIELGITFRAISYQLTILKILDLMYHSDLTFGEIAYKLEFSDQSHFNSFFKKQLKITPSEFRRAVVI